LNAGAQRAQSVSEKTDANPVVLFPIRQRRALDTGAACARKTGDQQKRTRVRFLFAPAGTRLPGFCIFRGRSPASHRGAAKGRKDELGLARLPEFDWKYYGQMVKKCAFGERYRSFIKLLKTTKEIKELAMNQQKMAGLRKDILAELPE